MVIIGLFKQLRWSDPTPHLFVYNCLQRKEPVHFTMHRLFIRTAGFLCVKLSAPCEANAEQAQAHQGKYRRLRYTTTREYRDVADLPIIWYFHIAYTSSTINRGTCNINNCPCHIDLIIKQCPFFGIFNNEIISYYICRCRRNCQINSKCTN